MEEKQGFVFLPSYYEAISELPPEERLTVYDALCRYALEGQWPEDLRGVARIVLTLIRPTLDRGQQKYKAARESGKKRGNPNFRKGRRNPYYEKDNSGDNSEDNWDKDIDTDIDTDKEEEREEEKASDWEKAAAMDPVPAAAAEPKLPPVGTYQNVFLSSGERERLQKNFPTTVQWHIDRLSDYLHAGVNLPRTNHCEAILDLAERDALRGDIQWGRGPRNPRAAPCGV